MHTTPPLGIIPKSSTCRQCNTVLESHRCMHAPGRHGLVVGDTICLNGGYLTTVFESLHHAFHGTQYACLYLAHYLYCIYKNLFVVLWWNVQFCLLQKCFEPPHGWPYRGLFSYGGNFQIFRIVEHHTTIKTTVLFYRNSSPSLSWAVRIFTTKYLNNSLYENFPLYGVLFDWAVA